MHRERSRVVGRPPGPRSVVVVGGGAAGVIVAAHLMGTAEAGEPLRVTVVESGERVGPGLAYRTTHPLHTLNNYAGRLSAFGEDPDHLVRWCTARGVEADAQSFLPRALYGEYLGDVLDSLPVADGSSLSRIRGTVVDLVPTGQGLQLRMDCGWAFAADTVVLALGNPPPRRLRGLERLGQRYVADPWAGVLDRHAGAVRRVLLLGTGLTMVDVAAQLHHADPDVELVAVSRTGLLPRAHVPRVLRPHDAFDPGVASLDELLDAVARRTAEIESVGGGWRDVVDSIRVYANRIWRDLGDDDQARFVAEVARRWEIHRHRMAPQIAEYVEVLLATGALALGRPGDHDPGAFDLVVNCTGPAPVHTTGWNPLVDALTERRLLRPHRLGLGLDLDEDGQLLDADAHVVPGVYAVGAARRGIEWEVAAVPDLRAQAQRLGDLVQTRGRSSATALLRPKPRRTHEVHSG